MPPLIPLLLCLLLFSISHAQDNVVPQLVGRTQVTNAVYSHSRNVIVTNEYRVNRVEFTDAKTKLKIGTYPTESPVITLAVDSSGKYFIAGTERGIIHMISADSLKAIRIIDAGVKVNQSYFVILYYFPILFTDSTSFYFTGHVKDSGIRIPGEDTIRMMDYFVYRYDINKDKYTILGRSTSNKPLHFFWNKKKKLLSLLGEKKMISYSIASFKESSSVSSASLDLSSISSDHNFLDETSNDEMGILRGDDRILSFYNSATLKKTDSLKNVYRFIPIPNSKLLYEGMDRKFYILDRKTRKIKPVTNDSVPNPQFCVALLDLKEGVYGAVSSYGVGTINLNVSSVVLPPYPSDPLPWGVCVTGPSTIVYGTENSLYEFDYIKASIVRKVAEFPSKVKNAYFIQSSKSLFVLTITQVGNTQRGIDSLIALDYTSGKIRWRKGIGGANLTDQAFNNDSSRILLTVDQSRLVELDAVSGAVINEVNAKSSVYGAAYRGNISGFYTALTSKPGGYCIEGIGKAINDFTWACFDYHRPIRVFAADATKDHVAIAYPEDANFYVFSLGNDTKSRTVSANARVLVFSPDNKWLAAGSFSNGYIRVYSFPSLELYKEFKVGVGKVFEIVFAADSDKIFAMLEDGHTSVISLIKREVVAQMILQHDNYIVKNDSGYYAANKQQVDEIGLRIGNRSFPISNADIKYNRPDLIIRDMGEKDPNVLKAYTNAYIKRLKQARTSEQQLKVIKAFPEAEIRRSQYIDPRSVRQTLALPVSFSSPGGVLRSINIWVNNVPVFGSEGLDVSKRNLDKLDTIIAVQLTPGDNTIAPECTNTASIRSTRDKLNVNYTGNQPSRIYFIGIGIDRFADSRFDLKYSAKDIRDLAIALKKKYGENLVIDTIFNENVTVNSILSLKKRLKTTHENDKVIVAYSGHGLLNKSYDYFLSTYSVNFDNPDENGLGYEKLENLIDSIPARRKLMLIDACHSGELDKDDVVTLNQTSDTLVKGLKPVAYKKEGQLGLKNSFELMQSLFVNVGKSTGATIISAAAGTQFALERNDLKNGVFTYSILELLEKYPKIRISELKKLVGERVRQITNGLQQPTSRMENAMVDWEL